LEGTSAGEDAPDRLDEFIEFCRLNDCGMNSLRPVLTRLRSTFEEGVTPEAVLPATPAVAQPAVLALPVVILRVLVLDEER
jgi:hypothetical protein